MLLNREFSFTSLISLPIQDHHSPNSKLKFPDLADVGKLRCKFLGGINYHQFTPTLRAQYFAVPAQSKGRLHLADSRFLFISSRLVKHLKAKVSFKAGRL